MNRRSLLAALTSAMALAAATGALAQTVDNFPNRPIRIIVPQAAGSGVDLQARTLAQKMNDLWGTRYSLPPLPLPPLPGPGGAPPLNTNVTSAVCSFEFS